MDPQHFKAFAFYSTFSSNKTICDDQSFQNNTAIIFATPKNTNTLGEK